MAAMGGRVAVMVLLSQIDVTGLASVRCKAHAEVR